MSVASETWQMSSEERAQMARLPDVVELWRGSAHMARDVWFNTREGGEADAKIRAELHGEAHLEHIFVSRERVLAIDSDRGAVQLAG